MAPNKNHKGLTLIELLVTIAVIAIVAAISVPVITNVIQSSGDNSASAMEMQIDTFVEKYAASGDISYDDDTQTFTAFTDLDGNGIFNDPAEITETFTVDSRFNVTGDLANGFTVTSLNAPVAAAPVVLNIYGTLTNTSSWRTLPTDPTNLIKTDGASTGDIALKSDGTVVTYGSSSYGAGALGLTNIIDIASGSTHLLALKSDGTVVAWGSNASGQTAVPAGLTSVVKVAAAQNISYALKSDGTIIAWGNPTGTSYIPTNLPTNIVDIQVGQDFGLVLTSTGQVRGWKIGTGTYGDAGGYLLDATQSRLVNVQAIRVGYRSAVALLADGSLVTWGEDGLYTMPEAGGQGCYTSVNYTYACRYGMTGIVEVGIGRDFIVAIKSDGTLVNWGRASYLTTLNLPSSVTGLVDLSVADYTVAILSQ
jgi:prepilin-type N-terminal cleavage/methylation domain-containing protein